MRNISPTTIVVGANDAIPDVLTRLRTASGGAATLAIPSASSLFLTASEFRALKATVDQSRIALTVETDDRLRRQLSTMFRIPVVDLLPSAITGLQEPEMAPELAVLEETSKQVGPRSSSMMADVPKLDLSPALEVAPKWVPRDPNEQTANDDTEPPVSKSKRRFLPSTLPFAPVWLGIGGAALLAVVLLIFVVAYVFQTATVTLTIQRQQVVAELTYAVVSPNGTAPEGGLFTLTASPVTIDVPYRETIQVTGELREPEAAAEGSVALRNPTSSPIEIPEGRRFSALDGVEYVFTTTITVPAADGISGAGRAEGQVRAVTGGENGNRDIGMLSGQLENGIYYSNRDLAVSGGTDRISPMVDQQDVERLVANASEQLPRRIVGTPLQDGRMVLPGSVQPGELSYTLDKNPGELADTLTIDAKMVITAMAFQPSEGVSRAEEHLHSELQANTPAGFEVEPDTMVVAEPELVNDQSNGGLYLLTATARTVPIIDETDRDAVANAIAGRDLDRAEAYVLALPYVESATISSTPGFLPKRIPGDASKIEIEIR